MRLHAFWKFLWFVLTRYNENTGSLTWTWANSLKSCGVFLRLLTQTSSPDTADEVNRNSQTHGGMLCYHITAEIPQLKALFVPSTLSSVICPVSVDLDKLRHACLCCCTERCLIGFYSKCIECPNQRTKACTLYILFLHTRSTFLQLRFGTKHQWHLAMFRHGIHVARWRKRLMTFGFNHLKVRRTVLH